MISAVGLICLSSVAAAAAAQKNKKTPVFRGQRAYCTTEIDYLMAPESVLLLEIRYTFLNIPNQYIFFLQYWYF